MPEQLPPPNPNDIISYQTPTESMPFQNEHELSLPTPPNVEGSGWVANPDASRNLNRDPMKSGTEHAVGAVSVESQIEITPAAQMGVVDGEFNVHRSDDTVEKGWTINRGVFLDKEGTARVTIVKETEDGRLVSKNVPVGDFLRWQEPVEGQQEQDSIYDMLTDPNADLSNLSVEGAAVREPNKPQNPVERQIDLVRAERSNIGEAIRKLEDGNEEIFAKYRKQNPDTDIPERLDRFARNMMEKYAAQQRADGGKDSLDFEAKAGEAINGLPHEVYLDATTVLSNYQQIQNLRNR